MPSFAKWFIHLIESCTGLWASTRFTCSPCTTRRRVSPLIFEPCRERENLENLYEIFNQIIAYPTAIAMSVPRSLNSVSRHE
jgi:hypothetical protein